MAEGEHSLVLVPTISRASRRQEIAAHQGGAAAEEYDNAHRRQEAAVDGADEIWPSSEDDDALIVAWEEGDPENPYNWSYKKKALVLIACMFLVINSTMASSLPSNAVPYIVKEWGIEGDQQRVLPMSIFLIGYVFGPLLFGPLSEQIGRRKITMVTFCMFIVWTMACGLAPNWESFLFFRFLVGICASCPNALVMGIFADVFDSPRTRGRAMSAFMATTTFGPLFAPIISGYSSATIGWRWTFWIALIYAGFSLIPLAFVRETYGPVLLMRRAIKMRRADPKQNIIAPHEMGKQSFRELAAVVLTRPPRMFIHELAVNTTCLYLSLVYAIFYMSFQAFPLIFQGIYGLSPGQCGLVFLPIGFGTILGLPIFWGFDEIVARAHARGDTWIHKQELRRLPLACVGGPLFVISLFWLGWTSRSDIHWAVPMLAGLPFGMGFTLIFMALINYLTDAYGIFAASANAAASCCRSFFAVLLPLASTPLFTRLGISAGCSLLGGLSLLMCMIPFIFIWKGERIRAGSKFSIALKQRREELERRVEAQRRRHETGLARSEGTLVSPSKEEV